MDSSTSRISPKSLEAARSRTSSSSRVQLAAALLPALGPQVIEQHVTHGRGGHAQELVAGQLAAALGADQTQPRLVHQHRGAERAVLLADGQHAPRHVAQFAVVLQEGPFAVLLAWLRRHLSSGSRIAR